MTGIIDVGGGARDSYGAGVFDYCLDHNIKFDYCIGVSAGSANCASYIANQRGRNYVFYTDYFFRKEYMSLSNFIKKGSYIDLDYVFGTLTNSDGENPIDYPAMQRSKTILKIVATNASTGKAVYFDKENMKQDDYRFLMASTCVPVVCKPYMIDGVGYYDGGIADPIPIDKALDDGCDKTVVILTRPKERIRQSKFNLAASAILKSKYRQLAESIENRNNKYNQSLAKAIELEKNGKALILAPHDIGNMKMLTKDHNEIHFLYEQGLRDGEKLIDFLK